MRAKEFLTLRENNKPRVCKTPGAYYDTDISGNEINVTVKLPPEVKIPNMSEKQGLKVDDLIHDAMEEIVADLIDTLDPKADLHWKQARKNDKISEGFSEGPKNTGGGFMVGGPRTYEQEYGHFKKKGGQKRLTAMAEKVESELPPSKKR